LLFWQTKKKFLTQSRKVAKDFKDFIELSNHKINLYLLKLKFSPIKKMIFASLLLSDFALKNPANPFQIPTFRRRSDAKI
jgi:hypothetical protein